VNSTAVGEFHSAEELKTGHPVSDFQNPVTVTLSRELALNKVIIKDPTTPQMLGYTTL